MKKTKQNQSGPALLINAGAQAAAGGLTRSGLFTKLLPVAVAAALTLRLLGSRASSDIRPAASPATGGAPGHAERTPNGHRTECERSPAKRVAATSVNRGGHYHG
jgi:hypothetical protein